MTTTPKVRVHRSLLELQNDNYEKGIKKPPEDIIYRSILFIISGSFRNNFADNLKFQLLTIKNK